MAIINTVFTARITSANSEVAVVPSTPDFIMASLVVSNTNNADATVQVKLTDANGTELARIVPGELVEAGKAVSLDVRSINVPAFTYQLVVQSDVVGVHFVASGGVKPQT